MKKIKAKKESETSAIEEAAEEEDADKVSADD
jgi:hypothetical protein